MDDQQPNSGFAMTFTSVTVIILSIFIYLNARATFEPVKRRKALASIEASFPAAGDTGPDSLDGLFPIPQAIRDLEGSSKTDRFGGVSLRDRGGSFEASRGERGITITIDTDALFTPSGIAPLWRTFLRNLCQELEKERWHLQFGIHESSSEGDWERSIERALEVRALLIESGAPIEVLSGRAFGSSRPIASNETPEGQRLNRRIELYLSDDSGGAL